MSEDKESVIHQIYTTREAALLWGLEINTVTRNCNRGRFNEDEARQSAATWIVTRAGMNRVFGTRNEQ